MKCDNDTLQVFLDGELESERLNALKEHLAACSDCRRELSHLRLLWFELKQPSVVDPPPELPFLRQQVISRASRQAQENPEENDKFSFWQSQKLAWQPLLYVAVNLPRYSGADQVISAVGLLRLFRGGLNVIGILSRRRRAK